MALAGAAAGVSTEVLNGAIGLTANAVVDESWK